MIFRCQFKGGIIVVTHVRDGHEYGFYVRAPGEVSFLSQRSPNLLSKSNAGAFAEAARVAASEFSYECLAFV